MNISPARPVLLAPILLLLACAPGMSGGSGAVPHPSDSPPAAQATSPGPAPLPREANADDALCAPLLIEPDFDFGTHVVMRRPIGSTLRLSLRPFPSTAQPDVAFTSDQEAWVRERIAAAKSR